MRHRLKSVTGCQKCAQGDERERTHGPAFPTDFSTLAKTAAAYVAAVFTHPDPGRNSGKEETTNENELA